METLALNNLWNYIQTLPLTEQNRQWLAGKLLDGKPMRRVGNKRVFQERLEMLSELQDNWDDEGALPIDKNVVGNVRALLELLDDWMLVDWNLFPAINGTLTFQHSSLDAVLSIGKNDYSFVYSDEGTVVDCVECAPFSLEAVQAKFVELKMLRNGEEA